MEVMYGSPYRILFMANDNSRKYKQNQIIFRVPTSIIVFSRPVVFGEDRLRKRGSLPATFFLSIVIFTSMFLKEMEVW